MKTPLTATHTDKHGNLWRICPTTRHWERLHGEVWAQDDSADELYPLEEAEPNGYSHTHKEDYHAV